MIQKQAIIAFINLSPKVMLNINMIVFRNTYLISVLVSTKWKSWNFVANYVKYRFYYFVASE